MGIVLSGVYSLAAKGSWTQERQQIISGETVTVIKAKIIKCGREAGVKIGNLRGKTTE